jgi:hypothetical protein
MHDITVKQASIAPRSSLQESGKDILAEPFYDFACTLWELMAVSNIPCELMAVSKGMFG